MFNFGDEFVIDSYKIPWLLWIQLLVMILLIILLFFFTSSDIFSPTSLPSSASSIFHTVDSRLLAATNPGRLYDHKERVREKERYRDTGTNKSGISKKEEIIEDEETDVHSRDSECHSGLFTRVHHPCNFLGVATRALLKCLGLDYS